MDTSREVNMARTYPRVGLGTAPIGGLYDVHVSDEQAKGLIHFCLDQDVTLIDSAPLYGAGEAERKVGLGVAGVPRESYMISTKVGRIIQPDRSLTFEYSRDAVMRSIESSRERLGIDYFDIVHIHDPDDHFQQALDEAFPTLAELRDQGVIGAIGAGMNQWEMLMEFARNADFDVFLLAGRYTLLEQTSLNFLKLCQEKAIKILAGGVFNSGILATGNVKDAKFQYEDAPQHIRDNVDKLSMVCEEYNVPLNAAALQFVDAHPAITTLAVGAISIAQVQSNLDALQFDIPAAFWQAIRERHLIEEDAPTPA